MTLWLPGSRQQGIGLFIHPVNEFVERLGCGGLCLRCKRRRLQALLSRCLISWGGELNTQQTSPVMSEVMFSRASLKGKCDLVAEP